MNDEEIEKIMKDLGLMIRKPPEAKEYFHIATSPPQGFPVVDIIRINKDSPFYLVTMGILIHPNHKSAIGNMKEEERREFLGSLVEDLLKMSVDIAILPPNSEVPEIIQVSKIVYSEGLTANEFLDAYYTVRNAGIYVINRINRKFGNTASRRGTSPYV
ncbi:DUF2299 domain-containing protein [Sulfurisphaera ohwakuensis]|uniref:DUF2299 domain-containing protein n=1 Tax=Sulfurisphaera ohwakuensis TaxID=69656 RepID=A0A650CI35_SULOH|nr:DUF2299 domain-containing protein [Sulfurisphaera ohwakuensis]MBB5254687.1 hypothetical protein [Sulfurisphaera ohwakuensis]QGR17335.1 DUF2299 domain-containing protein [Sulfurisphaera ohwakuensis]